MTYPDYRARAELYLGSDHQTALAQGPRGFGTAAQAIRFAFEEAAPVSLRGAMLEIDGATFTGDALAALYRSEDFPLPRKPVVTQARRRRRHSRQRSTGGSAAHRASAGQAAMA